MQRVTIGAPNALLATLDHGFRAALGPGATHLSKPEGKNARRLGTVTLRTSGEVEMAMRVHATPTQDVTFFGVMWLQLGDTPPVFG